MPGVALRECVGFFSSLLGKAYLEIVSKGLQKYGGRRSRKNRHVKNRPEVEFRCASQTGHLPEVPEFL